MATPNTFLKKVINCKFCQKEFIDYISCNPIYCSHKCANRASASIRRKRILLHCEICKKEISITPSQLRIRKKVRFCSYICAGRGMTDESKWTLKNCAECGKEKRVLLSRAKYRKNNFCSLKCSRKYFYKNPPYKAKGYWYENGYKILYLPDDKSIKEHIKVMQDYIGRKLLKNEIVHHINEIKDDNKLENLQVMTKGEHSSYHRKKNKREGKHLFGGYHNN